MAKASRARRSGVAHLVTTGMVWRSLVASVVVGGLLFVINHDASTLQRPWTGAVWRQLGLSMIVPFVVSFVSAVLTRRDMLVTRENAPPMPSDSASRH